MGKVYDGETYRNLCRGIPWVYRYVIDWFHGIPIGCDEH